MLIFSLSHSCTSSLDNFCNFNGGGEEKEFNFALAAKFVKTVSTQLVTSV